jgi:phosphoenolpyruvate---glycerone phosphotransferase subunit DhaL
VSLDRESFLNREGESVVHKMIKKIQENAKALSEIDGAIGDGDHGINMNKGFTICQERLSEKPGGFADGLETLGSVLVSEIGGAMGPLYGTFFTEMAKGANDEERIDAEVFCRMLDRATSAVIELGSARVGDKTMIDVLVPAADEFRRSVGMGEGFSSALAAMTEAAERGKRSTRDMVAKVGRSSRLGERSRGSLDPGATSCALLLQSMALSIAVLLDKDQ